MRYVQITTALLPASGLEHRWTGPVHCDKKTRDWDKKLLLIDTTFLKNFE